MALFNLVSTLKLEVRYLITIKLLSNSSIWSNFLCQTLNDINCSVRWKYLDTLEDICRNQIHKFVDICWVLMDAFSHAQCASISEPSSQPAPYTKRQISNIHEICALFTHKSCASFLNKHHQLYGWALHDNGLSFTRCKSVMQHSEAEVFFVA